MREKAAVYARYSSHSQTEQSIEGQLAAAQKYAEEHDYMWECYQKEDKETSEAEVIEKELENITRSIKNLVASVESGMPFDLIKDRLEELQEDKRKKEESLINLRVIPRLTKDHIVFFLEQFRNINLSDEKRQKRLVDTFVNSIYLYDDKLIVGLNYGGEEETITLENITESVRIENADLHFCPRMPWCMR